MLFVGNVTLVDIVVKNMNNTVNIKGSMVIRYVYPTKKDMIRAEAQFDILIIELTALLYETFDKDFMVKKAKVQDGTIIIEFKYPSLLAKEINLI